MRIRLQFVAFITGLWLGPAFAAEGLAGESKEILPPGAVGQLGSLRLRCRDLINCVAFSPDGKYVAAGGGGQSRDFTIDLWDLGTGNLVRRFAGHHDRFWDLAFTPDGSMLISGGADGVRFWDVQKGTLLRWTRTTGIVSALAISRDGKTCAAGTLDGAIHLWRNNGAEIIGSIASDTSVDYLEFSPDGRWLVSTGWDLKSKNTVRFWDVATRKKVWELPGQPLELFWRNSTAFSTDGALFVIGTEQGEVQIWNTMQKTKVRELKEGANGKRARILGFAKKDTLLFSLSVDGAVRIWDLENGKLLEKVAERFSINAALSPDAGMIAYGDDKNVKVWDVKAKEHRLAHPGHHDTIRSIDFSPDGKTLASCADDYTVRLWDVERRKELRQWSTGTNNHAWQVRYSKDGKTLITANWQYAELRDASSGKLKSTLGGTQISLTDARIGPDQKNRFGRGL